MQNRKVNVRQNLKTTLLKTTNEKVALAGYKIT